MAAVEQLGDDVLPGGVGRSPEGEAAGDFHTDQGVQFTSIAFTSCLASREVAISMDGRGRALDNVFIERLWRTVKYEDIYLKDYEGPCRLTPGKNGHSERNKEVEQFAA